MRRTDLEEHIIQQYRQDEDMMILIFAQWCVNHDLEPLEIYQKAYPQQAGNPSLEHAMSLTVPKEEAGDIPLDTLLHVLSLFDNNELAYVVSEEMTAMKKPKR